MVAGTDPAINYFSNSAIFQFTKAISKLQPIPEDKLRRLINLCPSTQQPPSQIHKHEVNSQMLEWLDENQRNRFVDQLVVSICAFRNRVSNRFEYLIISFISNWLTTTPFFTNEWFFILIIFLSFCNVQSPKSAEAVESCGYLLFTCYASNPSLADLILPVLLSYLEVLPRLTLRAPKHPSIIQQNGIRSNNNSENDSNSNNNNNEDVIVGETIRKEALLISHGMEDKIHIIRSTNTGNTSELNGSYSILFYSILFYYFYIVLWL